MFVCRPSSDAQVHFRCRFCWNSALHMLSYCTFVNSRRVFFSVIPLSISVSSHHLFSVSIVANNSHMSTVGYVNCIFSKHFRWYVLKIFVQDFCFIIEGFECEGICIHYCDFEWCCVESNCDCPLVHWIVSYELVSGIRI